MREHVKADEPFVREDVTAGEAIERFVERGPGLQGRADRGPGPRTRASRPSRCTPTAASPTSAAARTRPAPSASGVQAAVDRRRLLARRRRPPDAHPHLRHRVLHARRSSTQHLERLEQARARDHRKLGRELELFMFSELSPGLAVLAAERHGDLERADRRCGATENVAPRLPRGASTPILYDVDLFKQSGHWHVYRDNMYFTDVEDRPMGLKPMNCPAHVQLYKRRPALLPRPADPLLRAGPRPPPRAERHAARPAARPPHHPGRRPHLLHRGADRGRGHRAAWTSASSSTTCSASSRGSSSRPGPTSAIGDRGDVGPAPRRRCSARSTTAASSTSSTRATARSTARRSTCT